MARGLLIALTLGVATATPALAGGAVHHVDVAASGAATGTSWTDAFTDLQDALDAAAIGDQVWVARGSYRPDRGTLDPTLSFPTKSGVQIYGGFAGGETSLAQRDPVANPTVLTGDLLGDDGPDFTNRDDNTWQVLVGSYTGGCVVDGFTIRGGHAAGPFYSLNAGGGYRATSGATTFRDCVFTDNDATNKGGAVDVNSSTDRFIDCVFVRNRAASRGGAVDHAGYGRFIDCLFLGNTADDDGGGMFYTGFCGGGFADNVLRCTFVDNRCGNRGGGVYASNYCSSTETEFRDCVFAGNVAKFGGGIFNRGSHRFLDCLVEENVALDSGGGMYNWTTPAKPLIRDTLFRANVALEGGGVFDHESGATFDGCRFQGNAALLGAGLFEDGSTSVIRDCLIDGNVAREDGGGLYVLAAGVTVRGCTVVGNRAGPNHVGGGLHADLSAFEVSNSVFSGNEAGRGGGAVSVTGALGPSLVNCSLGANVTAGPMGAGVFAPDGTPVALANTVLWNNLAGGVGGEAAQASGAGLALDHCCVEGWTGLLGGAGNFGADPLFADALGPDGLAGTADDDLHLGAGSPCIDAGSNPAVPGDLSTDIDGDARFLDDPGVPDTGSGVAPIVDVGADEST